MARNTTPVYAFPYPDGNQPPALDLEMGALAQRMETVLQQIEAARAAQAAAGRLIRSGAQGVPTGAWTEVSGWGAETYRTGGLVYTAPRYVVQAPGLYEATGWASFAGNATGVRGAFLSVSSSISTAPPGPTATDEHELKPAVAAVAFNVVAPPLVTRLAAGQTVSLMLYQNSGGPLVSPAAVLTLTRIGN